MKCDNCGSEWNVSSEISASITKCPLCGKSLRQENATVINDCLNADDVHMLRHLSSVLLNEYYDFISTCREMQKVCDKLENNYVVSCEEIKIALEDIEYAHMNRQVCIIADKLESLDRLITTPLECPPHL